jgi:hypothetical protein
MKPYLFSFVALASFACFLASAMPRFGAAAPRVANQGNWASLPPHNSDSYCFQWRSFRLRHQGIELSPRNPYAAAGFIYAQASLDLKSDAPLFPDYIVLFIPRWSVAFVTLLIPMIYLWLLYRRSARLELARPALVCPNCGAPCTVNKDRCPMCMEYLPFEQPA